MNERGLRVAEGVGEMLDLVSCQVVLIVEDVVVHWLAGTL